MNALNMRAPGHGCLRALAVVALLLGSAMTVAQTAQISTPMMVVINFDPRELATPTGAQVLYQRIRGAAVKVCRQYYSRELERRVLWRKCYAAAISNAAAAVQQPAMTAPGETGAQGNPRG